MYVVFLPLYLPRLSLIYFRDIGGRKNVSQSENIMG